jgi:hypothetical protein
VTPVTALPSHERPILVVLRGGERPGEALRALLSAPAVRQHLLPAPWALERAGIDLRPVLPDVTSVTLGTLPRVLETVTRLATPECLEALVESTWKGAEESVRAWYLRRGLVGTLRAMFRVGPRTVDETPPAAFREDRVKENGFVVEYRLDPLPGSGNPLAPAEEASIAVYPFDLADATGRREAGLPPGDEAVLEVFAYQAGRDAHRAFLEGIARVTGWRVVDPSSA